MENDEKRMISSYEVTQSVHIGKKEVVFGVDLKEEYPFLLCYCTYDNPYLLLHHVRKNLHGFQIIVRTDRIRHPFCGQGIVISAVAD